MNVTPFQSVNVRFSRTTFTSWVAESRNRVALASNAWNGRARTGSRSKSCVLASFFKVSLNWLPLPPEGFAGSSRWADPTAAGSR